MNKIEKLFEKKGFIITAAYLAILSPFIYYLTTDAHYFLGRSASTAISAVYYALMIIVALYSTFILISSAYDLKLHKAFAGISFGAFIFTCVSVLFNVGYAVGFGASWYGYLFYLKAEYPILLTTLLTVTAVYLISLFKSGRATVLIAAVMIAIILGWAAFASLEIIPFKLEGSATVFDTGVDYSVVWASNDKSTGWIEYSYGGKDYVLYHEIDGRKASDTKIHYVRVPYEHLKNNSYTIHVQRVLSNRAYAPRTGKEITETINFAGEVGTDFNALILSDTHNIAKSVRNKINNNDVDVLFMLGDFIDELHREEDVTKYLLGLCYQAVGGTVPVVFARGNHDLHSETGVTLPRLLGFDKTYYQTHYGNFDFTVLDSCAGSSDDDPQLGGLADYEAYRKEQLEWMKTLSTSAKKQLLVTHVWFFTENADNFSVYKEQTERLNVKGILAGHSHKCAFYGEGFQEKDEEYLHLPTLVAGGVINLIFRQVQYTRASFTADKVTLTGYKTTQKEPLFTETINCN